MSTTLALTGLVMGLAGGPHCAAMCGLACAGVAGRAQGSPSRGMVWFQAGRLAGYTLAGMVAAQGGQALAWLAGHTNALRPAWVLLHLAVLAWGLMLLALARQPLWLLAAGRLAWKHMHPLAASNRGLVVAGALWTFMPCGLLYSALLVASLSGDALSGGAVMALFAAGSGLALAFTPWLMARWSTHANRWRSDWGTRLAGALLAGSAVGSLWMDTQHQVATWCLPLS